MRTQKRFTPTVLARFVREWRGQGTHEEFGPWHQVTRGDPASEGRSHLLRYRDRLRHLLSDGEFRIQLFITMLPDLEDVLEQYPLDTEDAVHPRCAFLSRPDLTCFPGTFALARRLGLRHPVCSGKRKKGLVPDKALWTMTTDFLVVTRSSEGTLRFLAIAFKPHWENLTGRKRDLLRIEREFWVERGIPWLLITADLYDDVIAGMLSRTGCWALQDPAPSHHIEMAASVACELSWASLTDVLHAIAPRVGSLEHAQTALWQAVWSGKLPIDLRRGWRPHLPLKHISEAAFWEQNPVAARRSAWI